MFKAIKVWLSSSSSKGGLSEKEKATARNEPYVEVVKVNIDKEDPGEGYFELDWNQVFVRKLKDAGYSGESEEEIIDQWFTALCSSVSSADY